jgi:hypothetical protein
MTDVVQKGNSVQNSNFAGRDIHNTVVEAPSPMPLLRTLCKNLREELAANKVVRERLETLAMYDAMADASISMTLTDKLTQAGRLAEVPQATKGKEYFYKLLARFQLYFSAQRILEILLADVHVRFEQHVYPAIRGGQPPEVVDALLHDRIIDPIMRMIEDDALPINKLHIRGMIYYLTSHCHLHWAA